MHSFLSPLLAAGTDSPAGGAATGEVVGATLGAMIATAVLIWLCARYRRGESRLLQFGNDISERLSGLPGWAALPAGIAGGALLIALFGMYWDISLHIDHGRDEGPLANPSHYFILVGLFGIFAAGVLAVVLPRERPGPAAVRITRGWHAPVGGVLMAAAGGFALSGFPLDDMWHRLFGQDVTLWGPTHLMLIGGAGLSLIGMAILLGEGMHARRGKPPVEGGLTRLQGFITYWRRLALMGGLLIGASTFQGEFDFGVPQFRLVFQPFLIAVAAGFALVAARIWVGRGGAIGAALFFLAVRGIIGLLVGPVLGETFPTMPLYLAEALVIEAAALYFTRNRPLALGVAGGALVGTIGFAAEWGWTQFAMPHAWTGAILPEALLMALGGGIAGGVLGALLGSGLRRGLPPARVARPAFAVSLLVIGLLVANGLVYDESRTVRGQVTLEEVPGATDRETHATVRFDPSEVAEDAAWVEGIAWQAGGKLVVEPMERTGDGAWRTTEPLPLYGEWKSLIRVHKGREQLAIPVFFPADRGIPAPEVPAPTSFTRTFVHDTEALQREKKDDVPGWIWVAASLVVLLIALGFVAALGWGVARVSRAGGSSGRGGPGDAARPSEGAESPREHAHAAS